MFLQLAALVGGGAQVPAVEVNRKQSASATCLFTKHLQWLDYADLSTVLQEAGFDGADLTVRPGGHVEPAVAATELPKARQALRTKGIDLPMVVTGITEATPGSERLLEVLADNGVRHYRMGYISYDHARPFDAQLDAIRDRLAKLADLSARFGLCANYQNHAGTRFGASLWDLWYATRGLSGEGVGCQFDLRHAVYEGARSWENDVRRLSPLVTTTVIKEFHWTQDPERGWRHRNVPLGEGMVDIGRFFALRGELGLTGPVSIHAEYPLLSEAERALPVPRRMALATRRLRHDVNHLQHYLN
jgi:sugar phosphate isomerase/epimerase